MMGGSLRLTLQRWMRSMQQSHLGNGCDVQCMQVVVGGKGWGAEG